MSVLPLAVTELEDRIGYHFKNREYLERALTHSSYSNEQGLPNHHLLCNERLEFLGDSVLSIITSEYLFETYRDCPEGDLTRMRADLVCERALSKYAGVTGLGDFLKLGKGEDKNNGRQNKSIVADAFEALLAAMYLDAEGEAKETVSRFLLPFIKEELEHMTFGTLGDNKTLLQQFVQQSEGDLLEYVTVDAKGPDHRKVFTVEARLNGEMIGRGVGRTKREAEQSAAGAALALFDIRH